MQRGTADSGRERMEKRKWQSSASKKNGNKFVKKEHLFVETETPFCPERGTWFASKQDALSSFTGNEVGASVEVMDYESVEYFRATCLNVFD